MHGGRINTNAGGWKLLKQSLISGIRTSLGYCIASSVNLTDG